jgi:hypothetical protein
MRLASAVIMRVIGRCTFAEVIDRAASPAVGGVSTKGQHKRSLRDVAAELTKRGFVSKSGKQFSASAIKSMLA